MRGSWRKSLVGKVALDDGQRPEVCKPMSPPELKLSSYRLQESTWQTRIRG